MNSLLDMWYGKKWPWLSTLLLPVSGLFYLLITARRCYYRHLSHQRSGRPQSSHQQSGHRQSSHRQSSHRESSHRHGHCRQSNHRHSYCHHSANRKKPPIPIIVVGNINLGGSGKSPLLIALATRLRQLGYSPGIISRGYGSKAPHYPFTVDTHTPAAIAGDEPLMIAQRTACPVVIDANRPAAAQKLLAMNCCNLILSDDGLQHYRLHRDLEIIVIDAHRQLGNNRLLPAGPLREPIGRLHQADWTVINGTTSPTPQWKVNNLTTMQLQPTSWHRLTDDKTVDATQPPWLKHNKVHAIAGIGNPNRFFNTLRDLDLDIIPHSLPDHHNFQWRDIHFPDNLPVVMTEKDAVKCRALLQTKSASQENISTLDNYWYLSVQAKLDEAFYQAIHNRLQDLINEPRSLLSKCC